MAGAVETEAWNRDGRIDVLRGMLLLLMVCNHIPSLLGEATSRALGMLSAAEGFVLLSALLAGTAIHRRTLRAAPGIGRWAMGRAVMLYATHAAMLAFGILWIVALDLPDLPISWIHADLLADPVPMGMATALLAHRPSFTDMLPIYILGYLAVPLLARIAAWDWRWLPALGALLWLAGRLDPATPALRQLTGLPLHGGSFEPCSWLGLFVAGVGIGWRLHAGPVRLPGPVVAVALVVSALCWLSGAVPGVLDDWLAYAAKESLGPVRVVALAAAAVALVGCRRWVRCDRWRWARPWMLAGRASLPLYAIHVPLVIVAQTVLMAVNPGWLLPMLATGLIVCCCLGTALWWPALTPRRSAVFS
ncbi:MAG: hypothetical protein RLZZ127_2987 [Planctomycetota bacterium]|jgi:hypothetical protein